MTEPSEVTKSSERLSGDRGSSMVAACVLLFAFTAGGVIWLSRDVNRSIADRSAAQSIAFQAARAGAQQVDVGELRGETSVAQIDEDAARVEASSIAAQLFEAYNLEPADAITVDVVGDIVTVSIQINGPTGDRTITGSAQAQVGS